MNEFFMYSSVGLVFGLTIYLVITIKTYLEKDLKQQ